MPWLALDELLLALPKTHGPLEIGGTLERFAGVQTRIERMRCTVRLRALERQLAAVPGFSNVRMARAGDAAELAFDVPAPSGVCTIIAKVDVIDAPQASVDLVVWDVVAMGPVDAPAHLLTRELIARSLSATFAQPWVEAHTPRATPYGAQVALGALLGGFATLPRGWKLPSRRSAGRITSAWSDDTITVQLEEDAETALAESLMARSVAAAWVSADDAVIDGDLDAAIQSLEELEATGLQDRWRRARLADLLLTRGRSEDVQRARALLTDDPLHSAALATRTETRGPTVASLSELAFAARAERRPLLELVANTAVERLLQLRKPVTSVAPAAPDTPSGRSAAVSAPSPPERTLAEARESGDPGRLFDALIAETGHVKDARAAAALWAEAGRVAYYDLEDNTRALAAFRESQALAPAVIADDYASLSALEDLYREDGEAAGLVRVLELKLAGTEDREMQNVFRITMATVLLDELAEPELALPLLDAALASDARLVPAKRKRAVALERLGRLAEACAELDEALVLPELDAIEAQDLIRAAAALHAKVPDQHTRAAELYASLFETFPSDTEAITGLKSLHASRGDWDAYLAVLDREFSVLAGVSLDGVSAGALDDTIPAPLRSTAAAVLREAATVHLERRDAPAQAVDVLQRAVALSSDDLFSWELLAAAARAAGDDLTLAEALETLAPQLFDPSARDAAEAEARAARERTAPSASPEPSPAPLLRDDAAPEQRLAEIERLLPAARAPATRRALLEQRGLLLVDACERPREALLPLKGALILDPSAVETRLALVRAYAALRDHAQAADQWRAAVDLLAPLAPTTEIGSTLRRTLTVWLRSEAAPRSEAWRSTLSERAPAWLTTVSDLRDES